MDKLPPQAIEAEESTLSACLVHSDAIESAMDILQPVDFYRTVHQKIYAAMVGLRRRGEPVDLITTMQALKASGDLEEIGGATYLARLTNDVPMAVNARHHAGMIKDAAVKRQLIKYHTRQLSACFEGGASAGELAEAAQAGALGIDVDSRDIGFRKISEGVGPFMENLEAAAERGGGITGITTGYRVLDLKTSGLQPADLIIIAGRPSMGKELPVDTCVLMQDGKFKRMGDVKVGDKVASVDGLPSSVTGIFPQGVKPVYQITFSDGRTIEAGLEHQWEVMYREWQEPRVLTTSKVIEMLGKARYKNRLYLPVHNGEFGVSEDIKLSPYLLGVLLGDGGLSGSSVKITTSYDHILEKIRPMLLGAVLNLDRKITYRITTDRGCANPILDAVKSLGLLGVKSHSKFIPEQYLSAEKAIRLELMRGLMDTDGTVEKTGAMTYTTTSERLATDVVMLSRSLGAFASMSSRTTRYSYLGEKKESRVAYTVFISKDGPEDFVTIPHKRSRVKKKKRIRRLNISKIEYFGETECQCISVSHRRALYVAENHIVTHNTALALNIGDNAEDAGSPVGVFSLEMSEQQLIGRLVAKKSRINGERMKGDQFSQGEWDSLHGAAEDLYMSRFYINDRDTSLGAIRRDARKMVKQHGVKGIIIDYLQLIRTNLKTDRKDLEVGEITRSLKGLAKELNVPIILLSQLNRQLEQRAEKRPVMSDLRESGAIEQDADVIIFVYRDEVYNNDENNPNKGIAEIIIAKNRNGAVGVVRLSWVARYVAFYDMHGGNS